MGRLTFSVGHTLSAGSLYKGMEEGVFPLPACSSLTNKSIPSLALEPTSLRVQLILKTSQDIQPCELDS